jgi:hypothetical protein
MRCYRMGFHRVFTGKQMSELQSGELQKDMRFVKAIDIPKPKGVDQAELVKLGEKIKGYEKEEGQIPDDQIDDAIGIAIKQRDLKTIMGGGFTPREYTIMALAAVVGAVLKGCIF